MTMQKWSDSSRVQQILFGWEAIAPEEIMKIDKQK